MKLKTYLLLAALGLHSISQPVRADETSDAIGQLKSQVEELTQKIKALERNREIEKEAAEEKKKATPTLSAGADGFWFRSAETNFALRIRGYGQFDGRYYGGTARAARDTFTIRRLRLGLEGTVYQNYDYKVLTDFGSGITSTPANNAFLQDAYVNIHYWPEFQVQLGKFKEPVSLEVLQSDANLLFVERGFPTQLAPNRDVGIQFQGDLFKNRLSYAAGVFNGVPDGGSGDVETTDSEKDFAGRIFAKPFKTTDIAALQGLALGVGASYGRQDGALGTYVTPGRQRFFSYLSGAGALATPNVAAAGEHLRLAPQGYWYWKQFGLFGEYVLSRQQVKRVSGATANVARLDNEAWNVAVSYVLTGEDNAFNTPTPLHPVSFKEGGWGAWEVAARYGELSIDNGAFPLFASAGSARKISSWGLGLNWYLNKNLKFNFDYEQSLFDAGTVKPNTVTSQDEHVFLGRAQFAF
ncbi:MAG: oprP [Verrucomicrobiales bacterium]|nr:oprP [Verrucomicrobiales bacterium]